MARAASAMQGVDLWKSGGASGQCPSYLRSLGILNKTEVCQAKCFYRYCTGGVDVVSFTYFLPLLLPSFLSLQYEELVNYGRLGKKLEIFWNKIS